MAVPSHFPHSLSQCHIPSPHSTGEIIKERALKVFDCLSSTIKELIKITEPEAVLEHGTFYRCGSACSKVQFKAGRKATAAAPRAGSAYSKV